MSLKKTHSIKQASLKSGFSRASGYRLAKDPNLPSQNQCVCKRRRPDPLAGIFEQQMIALLLTKPLLRPVATYQELLDINPHLSPGIQRTVERSVRDWRARHDADKVVFFTQSYQPGQSGICDFTGISGLGVAISTQPLVHKLYHFRLPLSGFTYAQAKLIGREETRREINSNRNVN